MSRQPLNRTDVVATLEFCHRIEDQAHCRPMRLSTYAHGLSPRPRVINYVRSERDVVAPLRVNQLLATATAEPAKVHYSSNLLVEELDSKLLARPGDRLLRRFNAAQSCFIEHASRCRVLLEDDAQQVIFIGRALGLVLQTCQEAQLMDDLITSNGGWRLGGTQRAASMVQGFNDRLTHLRAAVGAHPSFFRPLPGPLDYLVAAGDDRPQWRMLNDRLADQVKRLRR